MIQDLGDKKLYNELEEIKAEERDNVFCFDGDQILVAKEPDGTLIVPKAADFPNHKMQYLFRINEERYYLILEKAEKPDVYKRQSWHHANTILVATGVSWKVTLVRLMDSR